MRFSLVSNLPEFDREREAVLKGVGSHAYIVEGRLGQGKTSFALAVACAHFCVGEGKKPCFECPQCKKVMEGNHPDVHIIEPDRNIVRVDQIRSVISTVYESSYEGGAKIYIFKQFHLANDHAQNALLKTLEEPPQAVTFFLLSENGQALLPTVRSRCKLLRLSEYSQADILRELEERNPGNERNKYAAQASQGNIGNAVRLVEDEEFIRLDSVAEEIMATLDSDSAAVRIGVMLEKEKEGLLMLLEMLEGKLFTQMRLKHREVDVIRLNAVKEAYSAKKKNINGGLVTDSLAYSLAKGGHKWQR